MGRCWAVLLALLLGSSAGCFTAQPEKSLTAYPTRSPFTGPVGSDVVVMEIAQIERPVGDAYVNHDVWDFVDEKANPARKELLHANGFRMGQLGTTLPDRLYDLVAAECGRGTMRERRLRAGNPAALQLGGVWTQCRFDLTLDGEPTPYEVDKAQCVLEVVPTLTDDGRTTLRFTPLVKHGETVYEPRPVHDPSGVLRWDLEAQQPCERFTALGWDLAVEPNEYVVVGTRCDARSTLGHRCFLFAEDASPVQRLLVLRVVRSPYGDQGEKDWGKRPPPIALQASWSAARGTAP